MNEKAIAAIEMEGRIASAWKKLSGGLKELGEVLEDVIEPDQPELFPLDSSGIVSDVSTVLDETGRRLNRLTERAAGERKGGER